MQSTRSENKVPSQTLAAAIVEQARDPHSPLHGYFEWHDTVAAMRFQKLRKKRRARRKQLHERNTKG